MEKDVMYNAILFFGPPGSGKGTQAKKLAEKYPTKYLHFSTGDMFRGLKSDPAIANSPIGKKIAVLEGGSLVPDELTVELFFKTLDEYAASGKYNPLEQTLLLDGIPRNVSQVPMIARRINVQKVIYLFGSDLTVFAERIAKRALIEGRKDDADPVVVRKRLVVYEQETLPLIREYPSNLIMKIDALPTVEEIQENIVTSLK